MKLHIPTLNTAVWTALSAAVLFAGVFVFWIYRGTTITITNHHVVPAEPVSALSGLPCAGANRRPIAVMLSSDAEARPLSGIGQADMVFEMPVTPNGITRYMAVYQCTVPKEIGSIRSAREDFIPLAQGVDAVLAHWGGEHQALAELNSHIIDNVDAMKYEGTTFYRKKGIQMPHNGFSTLQLISDRAEQLGYRASTSMPGYAHLTGTSGRNLGSLATIAAAGWLPGIDVKFSYDDASNSYLRLRGGQPEIDATTGTQVHASVVVIMKTTSSFFRDQYIHVTTVGRGEATIYQNGRSIQALWNKPTATDMLTFTDVESKVIPLEPGPIWVIVDAPLPAVTQ